MTKQVEALIVGTYLRDEHASRPSCACGAVQGSDRQGHGEPGVAEGEDRLGGLAEALARRGRYRRADPGRHRRARPVGQEATSISLLVVLGVRRDGQKVLLAVRNMGGESEAAWRALLDDLVARGLKAAEFLIVDGAAGLEKALAALFWTSRHSAAPLTNTGTCLPMRRTSCTRRSRPTTPT
jgi:hypothetical protein